MEYDPEEFHHFIDDYEVEVVKKHGLCANQIPKDPNIFERNDFVITIINDFIEEKKLTILEIREMIKLELTDKIGDVRRRINGERLLQGPERMKQVEELLLELCQLHDDLMNHYDVIHLAGLNELLIQTIAISVEYKVGNPMYIEYAVSALVTYDPEAFTTDTLLSIACYNAHEQYESFQYLLEKTKHLRFKIRLSCSCYPHVNDGRSMQLRSNLKAECKMLSYETAFVDVPEPMPSFDDDLLDEDGETVYVPALGHMAYVLFDGPTDPQLVLLLLRYGAKPQQSYVGGVELADCFPIDKFATEIQCYIEQKYLLKRTNLHSRRKSTFKAVIKDVDILAMMTSVRYMLRADPYVHFTYSQLFLWNDKPTYPHAGNDEATTPMITRRVHKNYMFDVDCRMRDHFLPPCLTESVPSLFRLSRYVIRGVLLQNCEMPDGIKELPVPEHLKPFLDLLDD